MELERKKHGNKVEIKTQKTNLIQKVLKKRDKKSTLHLFHTLDGKVEQM